MFLAVATQLKSEMMSYLRNGYDVMNSFAKLEKFLSHGIIYAKSYDCWRSNVRVALTIIPANFILWTRAIIWMKLTKTS